MNIKSNNSIFSNIDKKFEYNTVQNALGRLDGKVFVGLTLLSCLFDIREKYTLQGEELKIINDLIRTHLSGFYIKDNSDAK